MEKSRAEYIAKKQGHKLISAYQHDYGLHGLNFTSPHDIVSLLTEISHIHLQWVANQYIKGHFSLEDRDRVKQELIKFDQVKSRLPVRDIHKYDLYEVSKLVKEDIKSTGNSSTPSPSSILTIYKGETIRILAPLSFDASCYLGKGTRWCTAALYSENTFIRYFERGYLYIIYTNDGRFQFHPATSQLRDESDKVVNPWEFAAKYNEIYHGLREIAAIHGYVPFMQNPTEEQVVDYISQCGDQLRYIKDQTPNIVFAAVKHYIPAIRDAKVMTPEIAKYVVSFDGMMLKYVKEQTEEIILAAISQTGFSYLYAKIQNDRLATRAVTQNGLVLNQIANQTTSIILSAVKQNGLALACASIQTEEIVMEAVKQNGVALQYAMLQTEEIAYEAVCQNGLALGYVDSPTERVVVAAVKQNGFAIRYVKNPSAELKGLALQSCSDAHYFF